MVTVTGVKGEVRKIFFYVKIHFLNPAYFTLFIGLSSQIV